MSHPTVRAYTRGLASGVAIAATAVAGRTALAVLRGGHGHPARQQLLDVASALVVDDHAWKRELPGIREYFAEFGDRMPRELVEQLDALEARLG